MTKKLSTFTTLLLLTFVVISATAKKPEPPKSNSRTVTQPSNIGVEKGKRKYCGPPNKTTCCGKSFCFVTQIADEGSAVKALDYFEGTLSKVNSDQLAIDIPFHKILPETYKEWFVNDIFEAEYFPLTNNVAALVNLSDIAISKGNYPVIRTNTGFKIIIKVQRQTGE